MSKKCEEQQVEKPEAEEVPQANAEAEKESQAAEGAAEQAAEAPTPAEPDWKDSYARLLADFDNYKKRIQREREDTYHYAEADVLGNCVLPVVDNLSLALSNAADKADDPFVKGVQLVYDSLLASLKDRKAEPFDSIGKTLDTAMMEAIATLPNEEVEEGLVSNEVKRGWMLRDKVLRAAQVVVSSGKANG